MLTGQFLIIEPDTGEVFSNKVYKSRGLAQRVLNKFNGNPHYEKYRIIEIPSSLLMELYENQYHLEKGV